MPFKYRKRETHKETDITVLFFNLHIYPVSESTFIVHKEIMMGKLNNLKVQKYYRLTRKFLVVQSF